MFCMKKIIRNICFYLVEQKLNIIFALQNKY